MQLPRDETRLFQVIKSSAARMLTVTVTNVTNANADLTVNHTDGVKK